MLVQILNGLAFGVLLLVLSSGLALIFGLRGVVNFAHGGLYMLGAYVGLTLTQHLTFWGALAGTPIVLAVIGVLLDRFGLRFLAHRGPLDLVLLTFGLAFVIIDLVQTVWGTQPRSLDPPAGLDGSTRLFGAVYPSYRLFLIVAGLLVAGALILWLRTSRTGLYVRAASADRAVAGVVGIDVDRVSGTVVGLGAGLAGLAGVLAAPYLSLSTTMGADIMVLTFIVVIVGGLGSLGGAMGAALLLGMADSLAAVHAPDLSSYVPYSLMLVVLLLRPRGFAGTRIA